MASRSVRISPFSYGSTEKHVLVEASTWKPSNTLHADESNSDTLIGVKAIDSGMEESRSVDILRGRCQTLPNVRSKVVRIFLSSTFSGRTSTTTSRATFSFFPVFRHHGRARFVDRMCVSEIEKLLPRKLRFRVPSSFD